MTSPDRVSRRKTLTPPVVLGTVAVTAVFGLLMFLYRYGDVLARAQNDPPLARFTEEMTGAFSALPAILLLLVVVDRFPIERHNWRRRLPAYAALVAALGVFSTLLMWGSRSLLFPALGLGEYDYGIMLWRIPMELSLQSIFYTMGIGLMHFGFYYRDTREARVRAAELEAALTRAQLDALEARLEPHFLFNTLNTISTVMYEDLAEADRLLSRLGDLLRRAMARDQSPTVPLRDELAWLDGYLGLMRQRFGPRLEVRVDDDPAAAEAPVPRFLLQPLVENAIRHGVGARAGTGTVEIAVTREAGGIRLEVRDNGRGMGASDASGAGIGLADTASRLALLYGDRHRFEVVPRPGGGTVARIAIPWDGTGD